MNEVASPDKAAGIESQKKNCLDNRAKKRRYPTQNPPGQTHFDYT
jgi:hypothetical protein